MLAWLAQELVVGLKVVCSQDDDVYADNKLVPLRKKILVGPGVVRITGLERLSGYVEKVKVDGVIDVSEAQKFRS